MGMGTLCTSKKAPIYGHGDTLHSLKGSHVWAWGHFVAAAAAAAIAAAACSPVSGWGRGGAAATHRGGGGSIRTIRSAGCSWRRAARGGASPRLTPCFAPSSRFALRVPHQWEGGWLHPCGNR